MFVAHRCGHGLQIRAIAPKKIFIHIRAIGQIFQQSTKVRAVYQQTSSGDWQLLTMFPDF